MKTESIIRILAGTIVLSAITLSLLHSTWWLALAGFVGVNLIQSALTGFCPAEIVVRRLGLARAEPVGPAVGGGR